jgi:GWxTD domain-containing protein
MKKAIAILLLTFAAASAFALAPEYANFPKGPAQFLLTKDELAAWKDVKTDEEAKRFIDLFWARRDPTPGTPANEFRAGYDQRVIVADKNFGENKLAGSMTDRGKVFVLLGAPTRMRTTTRPGGTVQTGPTSIGGGTAGATQESVQGYSPRDTWVYEQAKTKIQLGAPVVEFNFVDQYGTKDWKLERSGKTDQNAVFAKVANEFITQAGLTEPPTFALPAPVEPVAAPAAPVGITTPALRAAVDDVRGGKAAAANGVFVSTGEFITGEGERFVPVQLYVPKAANLTGEANVTFFGAVDKAEGGEVLAFEEEAMLAASKDDRFLAKSLRLEPGKYKGTFGIAVAGKPVSVVTSDLTVTGIEKDAAGISPLILSNNLYPLSAAQFPTDPYAFGGIKVVPKSDRVFHKTDELWYFFELRNPGLDATTSEPKLQVGLTVAGKTAEGKNVKMAAPPEETPARELKGVAGHWAVGQSMPLATFKTGEYTMTVKVKDLTSNQAYDLKETFTIVE